MLFAAVTALGVNVLFWGVLFKYRGPETTVKDSSSPLELLDLKVPDSGYMKRWIDYHDPAKSGSSAYGGGFSAQLPRRELFSPPAKRPRHTVELKASEVRKFRPLELAERKPVSLLPLPGSAAAASPSRDAEIAAVRATDDRGRPIRIPAAASAESSKRVTGDTVLMATPVGGKLNFILWRSCGDPALDSRAVGMVASAATALDPPPVYIFVRWPVRSTTEAVK